MPLEACENGDALATTKEILFRKKERDLLCRFMGPPSSIPYPCFFIYGHSSTGKTLVVSELLRELVLPQVWINCQEACSLQLLLDSIVQQICSLPDIECSSAPHCSNMCDLVNFLKCSLRGIEQTVYLIFDNAEILKHKHDTLLPALIRLQEITHLNIATILISDVVWEKFRGDSTGLFDPIIIHFSNYSKEQLIDILCLGCPPGYTENFYKDYINIIMKVFFVVTRNLNELRHVAQLNFTKYCEPLVSGKVKETDILKLFRNIEPTLKDAIHAVYLREVSGPKWNKLLQEDSKFKSENNLSAGTEFHMMKELPFYSKFLLIASYFASYNLPKTDYRHFVKNQGKQKKRNTRKSEKNLHLIGPKCFTLDRMLSIFFSIVGHRVLPSALILSQVSSLCSLKLISRISVEEQLDTPKYKCLAELDLVRSIGKTVNIDIMKYLDDFI